MHLKFQKQIGLFYQTELPARVSANLTNNTMKKIKNFCFSLQNVPEHALRFSPSLELLDLSANQLTVIQSSSFFSAQRLKHLNVSNNRVQRLDYDSFSPLFQVIFQLFYRAKFVTKSCKIWQQISSRC